MNENIDEDIYPDVGSVLMWGVLYYFQDFSPSFY